MRRGQPKRSGWRNPRNEAPRHYHSRPGGNVNFRPSRPYSTNFSHPPPTRFHPQFANVPHTNVPRYPMQVTLPPAFPFSDSSKYHETGRSTYQNRNIYKKINNYGQDRSYKRNKDMSIPPSKDLNFPEGRVDKISSNDYLFKNTPNERFTTNKNINQDDIGIYDDTSYFSRDISIQSCKIDVSPEKLLNINPPYHAVGHRPPSSDHYDNHNITKDASETFTNSINDTVNIVRKKLLDRNEPQKLSSNILHQDDENSSSNNSDKAAFRKPQAHSKKYAPKHRKPSIKENCNKIKNKIVHQLLKVDKDTMQKLIDNPQSSKKFEYAINSLIMESQNSFNRHMREVAGRSLCGSRTGPMIYEDDTVYEDIFMKQLQCILNPQESGVLSDIKPFVIQELNKVLQIDNLDQPHGLSSDDEQFHNRVVETTDCFNTYPDYFCLNTSNTKIQLYSDDDHVLYAHHEVNKSVPQELVNIDKSPRVSVCDITENESLKENSIFANYFNPGSDIDMRYPATISSNSQNIAINDAQLHSENNNSISTSNRHPSTETPAPYFDVNTEAFSDDDDPFEELDKQYHVDVDPNFIKNDDPTSSVNDVYVSTNVDFNSYHESHNQAVYSPKKTFDDINEMQSARRNSNDVSEMANNLASLFDDITNTASNEALENNRSEKYVNSQKSTIDVKAGTIKKKKQMSVSTSEVSDVSMSYRRLSNEHYKSQQKEQTSNVMCDSSTDIQVTDISTAHNEDLIKIDSPIERNNPETHNSSLTLPMILKHESNETESESSCTVKKMTIKPVKIEKFLEYNNKEIDNSDYSNPARILTNEKDIDDTDSSNPAKVQKNVKSRKRLSEQITSHRKEKRKKTDTGKQENNSKILNKNIIINLNDCASKPSENCDASAKSIFNLYFSKDQSNENVKKANNNSNMVDISYSDKYIKRRSCTRKNNANDNGNIMTRRCSSGIDKIKEICDSHQQKNENSQTPTKTDAKCKLKSIDMFIQKPRKAQPHLSLRNTTPTSKQPEKITPDKIDFDSTITKLEDVKRVKKILLKRSVSTQIINRLTSRETQTIEQKKFKSHMCQTDTKFFSVKATQTDNLILDKNKHESLDVFERMKEIDLEIQQLLQEKFKLYNSVESKETNTVNMQSLGMTVINLPEEQPEDGHKIDDFVKLSDKELEDIALQSDEQLRGMLSSKKKKKSQKRRSQTNKAIVREDTASNGWPTKKEKKKKPGRKESRKGIINSNNNISLLEQITDDTPLENMVYLESLEHSPIKTRKAKKKLTDITTDGSKPIMRKSKKKTKTCDALKSYDIKPCSVVLLREDFDSFFDISMPVTVIELNDFNGSVPESVEDIDQNEVRLFEFDVTDENNTIETLEILEHLPGINDLHFQDDELNMLDVSEDIVIDGNCDIDKSFVDNNITIFNDVTESVTIVSEDVIDNSCNKSNEEPLNADTSQSAIGCKTYDFSGDEELRHDSVSVTGNADAVLAIECVEDNFLAACLDGNVYHFNTEGQLLGTLRGSNLAVTCLSIVEDKYGITVYTGSLDSRIRCFDLQNGLEKAPECNVLSPIQTMDRAWDTIFVGTRTGFVLQFECKNNLLIPVSTIKFSEQSILALKALKEGPRKVLLVAARSENVTIKDALTGLLLRTLEGPKMTVYTLLYENGKVYCGTSSNQIQVFDYASGMHAGEHDGGKGAVCLRFSGSLLFAGCYDGCVYVYRSGEREPIAQLRGPGIMLLSLTIVGGKIIVGYKDRSLYIWKMPLSILQEMVL